MSRLFPAGCLCITPGINELISQGPYLNRHLCGDWGDTCDDDKNANNHAVSSGGMILSAYQVTPESKIWILTDGGTTTIMLPCEY
ncbi:plasmid related protein [Salmonella enterica]|nr:plasmid related protein [Salmonella enterica]EKS4720053.1 plasmid related protein [Salmonella enterica]EKS4724509.1 plasmid related protein [Salmonella enterica]EKS4738153.1 plasmid related protein [Salmonella enterica]EKS4775434.1 plasmid related protein [Salmonella enterica]